MERTPISSVMQTALENIKDMVDVNTVVGEPMVTSNGSTVIPVSRVSFGFIAGGGEYAQDKEKEKETARPFAGGSGAGVSLQPVGFLILGEDGVHMLPAQSQMPWENTLAMLPKLISDIRALFSPPKEQKETLREARQ